jgi:hypothetical protein
MPSADFSKKPQGFRLLPEGEQTLQITKIEGVPRTKVTMAKVEFVSEDGIKLKNNYDLTSDGGYAAFYYLVQNGCGFELDGEFDIDQIADKFVLVNIVHVEGKQPRADGSKAIFANIKSTIGPGTPFGEDANAAGGENWED